MVNLKDLYDHTATSHLIVLLVISLASAITVPTVAATAQEGQDVTQMLYSVDSQPFGLNYSEWHAKYWQWLLSVPTADFPVNDPAGTKCSLRQIDPNVWFMAQPLDGSAQIKCFIPYGKAIFIPIVPGECDYLSDSRLKTESDLRECAFSGIRGALMQAEIVGVRVENIQNLSAESPIFNLTISPDNIYGGEPSGDTQAVAVGYALFFKPLPPGEYRIHTSASMLDDPTLGTYSWAVDTEYHLIVEEPNLSAGNETVVIDNETVTGNQ
jgi:hypothetical protein